jgi:hypothetical protein
VGEQSLSRCVPRRESCLKDWRRVAQRTIQGQRSLGVHLRIMNSSSSRRETAIEQPLR